MSQEPPLTLITLGLVAGLVVGSAARAEAPASSLPNRSSR